MKTGTHRESSALDGSAAADCIEVVCGVIGDGRGRVLACRRARHRHLGGLWEFPGGKVEPGEEPRAALARELAEELEFGGQWQVGEELEAVVHRYPERTIRLRPWRVGCEDEQALAGLATRPQEHQELRWLALGDLGRVEWAPADWPVVAALQRAASSGKSR